MLLKNVAFLPYIVVGVSPISSMLFRHQGIALKHIRGAVLMVALLAAIICIEFKLALWVGLGLVVIDLCAGLIIIVVALYRAPEARESSDGLHIRESKRQPRHIPHPRFSQLRERR